MGCTDVHRRVWPRDISLSYLSYPQKYSVYTLASTKSDIFSFAGKHGGNTQGSIESIFPP